MKKRLLSLWLAGATIVALLSGCGAAGNEQDQSDALQTAQTEQTASAAQSAGASNLAAESGTDETAVGKTLVVYYSATGTTEKVAGMIADATGGELYALEPVEPYTDADLDWTDSDSRVVYEHDNPEARAVALAETAVPGWESYDTVFIGYPIWWGIAAWPVDGFVAANDFSGKTVIPFCTSSSSGLGESGRLLAEMAGTGNWLEGTRFASGISEAEVQAWVQGLGL